MELKTSQQGSWKVLHIGERRLDALVAEELKAALLAAVSDGTRRLAVDLAQVEFMDSSGLGAIIHCRQRVRNEVEIALCGPRLEVATLLRLTQIGRVFKTYEHTGAIPADRVEQGEVRP